MNLSYNTQLPPRMAVPSRPQASAWAPPPGGFGAAYDDNARAMSTEAAGQYNRAADQANFGLASAYHRGRQGLALEGLQNMAQDQGRAQNLGNARLQTMLGALRGLA